MVVSVGGERPLQEMNREKFWHRLVTSKECRAQFHLARGDISNDLKEYLSDQNGCSDLRGRCIEAFPKRSVER